GIVTVFSLAWIAGSPSGGPGPGADAGPEDGLKNAVAENGKNAAAENGWTFDTGLEEKLEAPAFDGPGKGGKTERPPFVDKGKGGELPPGARRLRLPWKGIHLTKPLPPAKPAAIKPTELTEESTVVRLAGPVSDTTVGGAGRFLILHLPRERT